MDRWPIKSAERKSFWFVRSFFPYLIFTSGFAAEPTSFGIQRFIAGLGLGGVMPNFGWRAVVWLGALPLIFMPILYKLLPESINYFMTKTRKANW